MWNSYSVKPVLGGRHFKQTLSIIKADSGISSIFAPQIYYNRTFLQLQRPPWEQRLLPTVERWPLMGDRNRSNSRDLKETDFAGVETEVALWKGGR